MTRLSLGNPANTKLCGGRGNKSRAESIIHFRIGLTNTAAYAVDRRGPSPKALNGVAPLSNQSLPRLIHSWQKAILSSVPVATCPLPGVVPLEYSA